VWLIKITLKCDTSTKVTIFVYQNKLSKKQVVATFLIRTILRTNILKLYEKTNPDCIALPWYDCTINWAIDAAENENHDP